MKQRYGIGIDIGGTEIKTALLDASGKILHARSHATVYEDPDQFSGFLISVAESLLADSAQTVSSPVEVIGVTFPGIVENGMVTGGAENFPGIEPFPLKKILKDRFALPVITMNDAAGMALGEFFYGAARGKKDALFLTIGTGIGGCVMIDGRIYNGTGDRGGELGHIVIERNGEKCGCGGRGCFQLYGSVTALLEYFHRLTGESHPEADGQFVVQQYLEGNRQAAEAMEWHFRNIAAGLGSLTNIFCPPVIVLGGGIVNAGSFYTEEIRRGMAEYTMDHIYPEIKIVAAQLGHHAACAGPAGQWFHRQAAAAGSGM